MNTATFIDIDINIDKSSYLIVESTSSEIHVEYSENILSYTWLQERW